MFGLSYSSIDIPRDKRRWPNMVPSLEPPELVENARPRSIPGMQTDVNRPCPLQNNKIECATFAGCWRNNGIIYWKLGKCILFVGNLNLLRTASTKTSPARSIFNMVMRSLFTSRCSFSTTDAYGLNIPVISKTSILHSFNDRSLRLLVRF